MEVILNINNLDYQINNENYLFQNICLSFEKNKITCISGPNNCGKTTLLRILKEKRPFDDSVIVLDGKDSNEYKKEDYEKIIQGFFPNALWTRDELVLDFLYSKMKDIDMEKIEFVLTNLGLMKNKDKNINKLTQEERYRLQLAEAIIKSTKIVLIDNLDHFVLKEDLKKYYAFFKKCMKKYHLTFITTTHDLYETLYADDLYIIEKGHVILRGKPQEVLTKDNILNKAGLELPFMIDLSVKLKDYDLIDSIILDKESMIDKLWN